MRARTFCTRCLEEVCLLREVPMRLRPIPPLLATVGAGLAQSTWIVDIHDGPGANFHDLPAAVAAAADGDRLLVRGAPPAVPADLYSPFGIDGKGLTIIGIGTYPPVVMGLL